MSFARPELKPAFLLAGLLVAGQAASAQSISASDPDSIVAALRDNGYRATLTKDNQGDPLIKSGTGGVDFQIVFYGCNDFNAGCQDILFRSGFDLNEAFSLDSANSWNANKLVGKAYVDDENDPILLHFVAGLNAMPDASFRRLMKRWDAALSEFTDYIGW